MRFFHISDLHLGKQLGGMDLSEDMRYVLFGQVLGSAYEQFRPDGLIIAGDVYDKSSPSAECISLFDEFLSRAAELSLPVFAISGNHDSAQRISYGRDLFRNSGVYLSEPLSAEHTVSVIPFGDIDIALLPYISAEAAVRCFPDDGIDSIDKALQVIFDRAELPREGRPCILVAHQAAVGSPSEAIGSIEAADYHVFDRFAYTALGHFHTPKNIGGPRVRYCGSPLCFSSKEAKSPQKYIDIIDIDSNGDIEVTNHPIQPLRKVSIAEDSFEALMSDRYAACENYMFITVMGGNAESDAARLLQTKFPYCVKISYERQTVQRTQEREYSEMEFGELFSGFYRLAMGEDIDEKLLEKARELFGESEKGDSYGS